MMSSYYFAYGSHMLSRVLQAVAPSALRVDIGKLSNFRLDFAGYSEQCRGALATVVPATDATVYGAIWKVDHRDLERLDVLEASPTCGAYKAFEQCVERGNGSMMLCRMHQHSQTPHCNDDPLMRWKTLPSLTYLDAIRAGAKESHLPDDYINFLFKLIDNGRTTSLDNMADMEASRRKDYV